MISRKDLYEILLEDLRVHGNGDYWTGCAGCGGNQLAPSPPGAVEYSPHAEGCVIGRLVPLWIKWRDRT